MRKTASANTPPTFEQASLQLIINDYTREAGVRNLQRSIGSVCRKLAKEITQGKQLRTPITPQLVEEFLGHPKFFNEVAAEHDRVGVVTGMAWTETGGDIIFVEATSMKGKGDLILTGSLGDVMKESARTALSYIQANSTRLGIPADAFEETTIHIHVPAGSIPKDGPSAGITMATALVSLLTGLAVRDDVAMTGEITLRGQVLPVGGIKEKALAAQRAGISGSCLPFRNEVDLDELPAELKDGMTFIPVRTMDEALAAVMPEEFLGQRPGIKDSAERFEAVPDQQLRRRIRVGRLERSNSTWGSGGGPAYLLLSGMRLRPRRRELVQGGRATSRWKGASAPRLPRTSARGATARQRRRHRPPT